MKQIPFVFLILTLALSWILPDMAPAAQPLITDIEIHIAGGAEDQAAYRQIALDLIRFKAGQPFSEANLQDTLSALRLCNRFETVQAETREHPNGLVVVFELKVFRLIRKIRIHGNFPLFEREILNVMTLYPGDAFSPEALKRQEPRIVALFVKQGYVSPEVRTEFAADPENRLVTIDVHIQKGPYSRLKRIDFTGNQSFSPMRLKFLMKTWRAAKIPTAGRFTEDQLKKDIRNLKAFYWKRRFPEARITYAFTRTPEDHGVTVDVTIEEGPRYDVRFSGNHAFYTFTLKKDLVLFKEGNFNDRGLRKSLKSIRDRYHRHGFDQVEVNLQTSQEEIDGRQVRKIDINIEEGPQKVVADVAFDGNHHIVDPKLAEQVLTRPPGLLNDGALVPDVLQSDILSIQSVYLKNGFMSPEIEPHTTPLEKQPEPGEVQTRVRLDIREGVRTRVAKITFEGLAVIDEDQALAALEMTTGKPFREYMLKSEANRLAAAISEKGRPHVTVKGSYELSPDHENASLSYAIDPGPFVRMGHYYFKGNFRTQPKILKRETVLDPGAPFSLKKMLETQRNIQNLDIFDSVQFKTIGLKENAETVHVFGEIEEKKPYYVELAGGYSTECGAFAEAKAGDHNMLGAQKTGEIGASVSQIGYRGDLGLTEPRLWGSLISASAAFYSERQAEFNQSFGTTSHGATFSLTRKWIDFIDTSVGVNYELREQFSTNGSDATSTTDETFDPRNVVTHSGTIALDRRDSRVRPRKGYYAALSMDISNGLDNDLDDFIKYALDTRYFWTPRDGLTLAAQACITWIDPLSASGDVSDDQLLYLGGTTDVRGYDENMLAYDAADDPVGGLQSVNGSLEARIDLGYNLEWSVFLDGGQVMRTVGDAEVTGFRPVLGAGLHYLTPIGPVGLMYGFKLDARQNESPGRFHFAIGYTF